MNILKFTQHGPSVALKDIVNSSLNYNISYSNGDVSSWHIQTNRAQAQMQYQILNVVPPKYIVLDVSRITCMDNHSYSGQFISASKILEEILTTNPIFDGGALFDTLIADIYEYIDNSVTMEGMEKIELDVDKVQIEYSYICEVIYELIDDLLRSNGFPVASQLPGEYVFMQWVDNNSIMLEFKNPEEMRTHIAKLAELSRQKLG